MSDNIIKKDWGLEITWANETEYCAKILLFENPKSKTPFVFHKETKKTFFVNVGEFKFRWIDTTNGKIYEQLLKEGSVHTVEQLVPWSLEGQTSNASVNQVSNRDDKDDVYVILGS